MNLKKQIKESGQAFMASITPEIDFAGKINFQPREIKPVTNRSRLWWTGGSLVTSLGAAATVFAVVLTSGPATYASLDALNQVRYPSARAIQRNSLNTSFAPDITRFMTLTTPELFIDEETNHTYSPLSVYYALALLLEGADGATYDQVASLMNVTDIEALRTNAKSMFENFHYDIKNSKTEYAKANISNGIFVNELYPVNESYLTTLAQQYYSEVFHTDFSDTAIGSIADWLNDKTYDFLDVKKDDLEVSSDTVFALYNTIYLKTSWDEPFNPDDNLENRAFINTSNGQSQNVTLMSKTIPNTLYVEKESYKLAVDTAFDGNRFVFVLPETGSTPLDLISDPLTFESIIDDALSPERDRNVYLCLPKLKTKNKFDLKAVLSNNGIIDAFDSELADFSKALPQTYVNSIFQTAGIEFNEAGAEAASFTEVGFENTAIDVNAANMYLNRSFMYMIITPDDVPVFIGTINGF